jgi:transglutaminase-like putative cysteine protease/sugar lactone lactonase YvrE
MLFSSAAFTAGAEPQAEPFSELFELTIDKPGGMAFDGELLWITDRVGLELHGLDPNTGEEMAVVQSPGPWPTGLAFDGSLLWVADRNRNRLFGVDTKRGVVRREVESPANPLGLAFDGEYLWVADGKRLHRVTTEDGTTIVSFNAPPWSGEGRGSEQLGLAYAAGGLWVSDRKTDRLYRVDPKKGEVLDLMPSPGPLAAGLAMRDGELLIADVDRRRIDSLSTAAVPQTVRHDPRDEIVVLRRQLINRGPGTLEEAEVFVAIPKDAANQKIAGAPRFEPRPDAIVEDRWGQKFARFVARDLVPGESLDLTMTVEAKLFAVRRHIDPSSVGGFDDIPEDAKAYLADGSKYALEHPSIKRHLKAAVEDETELYWMLRKIARYIQERMHYELVGGWNIAPTVIDRGSGSCSEYTFVFISMCRAAGIPARYAGAIVIRGDDASTDEVFHRWAEVYLPGYGWVPFDVQAGDKPTPEKQGEAFGNLPNRFLVTTLGGGGSEYIGWDYNSTARWSCRGRCDVADLHLGDWYPDRKQAEKP